MKITTLFALIAFALLSSCSPKMYNVWTKENFQGKEFEKVLVYAIAKNNEAARTFEDAVVQELEKKGIHATNSSQVLSSEGMTEEEITSNVEKGKYDGVLVSWLADVQTRKVSLSSPDGFHSEVGNYRSYINTGNQFVYEPDDYREEKSYILETKLFDPSISNAEEAQLWSGQSSITDPSSFFSGAKDYAAILVKTLTKTQIIKTPK